MLTDLRVRDLGVIEDLALTFGLGRDEKVTKLSIEWPRGTRQNFSDIAVNQFLLVDETKGVIAVR